MADTLHAEQKLKSFLLTVAQQNASDLHLVVGRYPTIRVDGRLIPLTEEEVLTPEKTKDFSKVLLTEKDEKELLEKGQSNFSYDFEGKARFRTSVYFQQGKLSVAMRLIQTKIRTLEELEINPSLYDFAQHGQGLVLVTGPVGHGKSTTLAAIIDYINHNFDKHIMTIEDPIEYIYQQDRCLINQREVGHDTESFALGLRGIFREDVNVLLIGEMRDLDTIATTMTAAETGHLIFATLHTNNCAQTVDRIVDVFPAHQQNQIRAQLANVLLGVVSQRLIPKIGGGRTPAVEIMIKNHAVGNLIRENKSYQIDSIIETSLKEGMVSLDRALSQLVKNGIISIEDAFTYTNNKEYLKTIIKNK
ncbi:MAG: PilT/PilU family type 4a pilus ATPase [Candidatus Moranbacteria bacterium]|jgi:twitching motility protein PilT|nr:PilT/PilU family type 4a pilus ATPase [Candidatus Moranbacteria bacterium]MDD5652339.1 PilT/PilU family type 4a pilus ATPase [Candidatus Moranbacteria bacterium]MDX9855389.1 PilT/PilU family type 4a pilus ATPase [Candidatus Moranbacteria bacterium]